MQTTRCITTIMFRSFQALVHVHNTNLHVHVNAHVTHQAINLGPQSLAQGVAVLRVLHQDVYPILMQDPWSRPTAATTSLPQEWRGRELETESDSHCLNGLHTQETEQQYQKDTTCTASTSLTLHVNSGVMVSCIRATPRVMGCRLATSDSLGKASRQPRILSPARKRRNTIMRRCKVSQCNANRGNSEQAVAL